MHLITKTGFAKIFYFSYSSLSGEKINIFLKEHLHLLRLAGLVEVPDRA
jgi:hypothetical protein